MKFHKTLIIGVVEGDMDKEYWNRINALTEKKVFLTKESPQIKIEIKDADCLLVKFQTNVDKELIDSAPKLKYIGVMATAYGTIDTKYAKSKGILVTNVPGYSTQSVAELVFGMLLENLRDLERAKRQVREGNYFETGFSSTEIAGKVFGILGLGRIGTRVAEIAHVFGADVRYWSRNRKAELENKGIKYEDVDSLISKSDILSLHAAQTEDTTEILNEKRINSLKKGAIVIVTTPVELVDMKALERRVKSGEIIFMTDHSDQMKPEDVKRLSGYKNAVMYPPIAYISNEARIAKQEIFTNNLESFMKGKIVNTV